MKVQGSITAGGAVVLDAKGEISATKTFVGVATSMNIQSTSQVQALVGSGAVIQAESLSVLATTESLLSATAKGGLGVIALTANQTTTAKVAGGAKVTLGETENTAVTSLLVQAIDRSSFVNSLNTADSLVTKLAAGFDLGVATIDITRATTAQLGDAAKKTSLLSDGTEPFGAVQVSAASVDSDKGGIKGEVNSALVGVQTTTAKDTVLALVQNTEFSSNALQVYALNTASHSSKAKVAKNNATGSVAAQIKDSIVTATGAVHVVAIDQSKFTASSEPEKFKS